MAVCQECGTDARSFAFCPKCGSTKLAEGKGAGAAPPIAQARQRLGLRMTGVFLVVLGLQAASAAGVTLLRPDDSLLGLAPSFTDRAGGMVEVLVLQNGTPVPGATIQVLRGNGTGTEALGNATADGNGTARIELGAAHATLVATSGNATGSTPVLVLDGTRARVEVKLGEEGELAAAKVLRSVLRGAGIVLAALSLMMVWGGIATFRLRQKPVAYAGGGTAILMGVFFTALGLPGLLVLLVAVLSLVTIVRRRHLFQ